MMFKVYASTPFGVDGKLVTVECSISNALPTIKIVGLPTKAVDEAKERVLPAIKNSGFNIVPKRITINLAPSHIAKHGSSLDVPIALSILGAYGFVKQDIIQKYLFLGELSLSGQLREAKGTLQALQVQNKHSLQKIILPTSNMHTILLPNKYYKYVKFAQRLQQIIQFLRKEATLQDYQPQVMHQENTNVSLNKHTIRLSQIVAAGRHHLLMVGSPGCGKTFTAKTIKHLLPPLTEEEVYQTALIYESSNLSIPNELLQFKAPFRAPHHTSSYASLIGGGSTPTPGEISLAHNGILFLDEFAEFDSKSLNALREPLEEHSITISRSKYRITYPAQFTLVAAMNPCPCGYYKSGYKECTCTMSQLAYYRKKVSQILLDRFDLYTYLKRPSLTQLETITKPDEIKGIKDLVKAAVEKQHLRYKNEAFRYNSQLPANKINQYCKLDNAASIILKKAYKTMNLSPRGRIKIIRTARTIADLENSINIKQQHIIEALGYRIDSFNA